MCMCERMRADDAVVDDGAMTMSLRGEMNGELLTMRCAHFQAQRSQNAKHVRISL